MFFALKDLFKLLHQGVKNQLKFVLYTDDKILQI
jgi:hypothetical protein